jgi:hypothetical protein
LAKALFKAFPGFSERESNKKVRLCPTHPLNQGTAGRFMADSCRFSHAKWCSDRQHVSIPSRPSLVVMRSMAKTSQQMGDFKECRAGFVLATD